MRINNIQNSGYKPSFGLKIVENDSYKKLVNYYKDFGAEKKINDVFENIKKLENDDMSLEFLNFRKAYLDLIGITMPVCNIRLFGRMKGIDSDQKYPVDSTTEQQLACDLILPGQIKTLLNEAKDKIDAKNWL